MSAELLRTATACRSCGQPLTLEEMHYLGDDDGTATCSACEAAWCAAVSEWLADDTLPDTMPEPP